MSIARAIDVGHGNTKFTTSSDSSAKFDCSFFPSIAPQAAARDLDLGSGVFSKLETVNLVIDAACYTVGKDVKGHGFKRILGDSFSQSNVYMALVRGALYHMGSAKIDMLMLGLPVNTYKTHAESLQERMSGRHVITVQTIDQGKTIRQDCIVDIGTVAVMPQPMGAFYNYCIPHGLYNKMSQQRNLIIDVGYGTLDWFVVENLQPDYGRCGAEFTGMSSIVRSVADAISPTAASNSNVLKDIDKAIFNKGVMKHAGRLIDVCTEYKSVIETSVHNSLAGMLHMIGDPSDLHNIIVTGGGASTYMSEIAKVFRPEDLHIDHDGMYSNVLGFQMVAQEGLRQSRKKAA